MLYVAIGLTYALSNGLHPAEPGRAAETINPGDFAFAYLGTPIAAWLGARLAATAIRRRSHLTHAPA